MEVGGEGTAVSKRIASSFVFATSNMREELARALVPLARVGLIDRIGSPVRRHLHVLFPQDELAERPIERENIDARTRSVNELRRRTIQYIACDELLRSRDEDVVDPCAVAGRAFLDGEDSAERTVYIGIR